MKIIVTHEFDGKDPVAEMVKFYGEALAAQMAPAVLPQAKITINPSAVSEPFTAPAVEAPAAPVKTRKPRNDAGKPRKKVEAPAVPAKPAPAPEVAQGEPAPAAPVASTPTTTVTTQQLQDAMTAVFAKFGLNKSLELVQRFGVRRVSELKPEQHAAFHKLALEMVAE